MASKETTKQEPPEVAEFQKELYSLFDSRTASASKIDRLTKLAIKAARYYKNIVYHLEKFITRCVPEYKLTGLYVLDSICRTSQSVKTKSSSGSFSGSEYVSRIERNIEALFVEFCKVQEDKEKEKVKRVVDLWERSGTFASTVTENIKKKYFPLLETAADTKPASSSSVSHAEPLLATNDNSVDKTVSLISSLAASFPNASEHVNSTSAAAALSTQATPSYLSMTTPTEGALGVNHSSAYITPVSHLTGQGTPGIPPSTNSNQGDNSFLAGISDPSSALALQTLLATVSQVKAATAASAAAPPVPLAPQAAMNFQLYSPSAMSATTQVPAFQSSVHTLPPVLQQLQGVLLNSNQNGAILPNNNTMVSSTSVSPFLHTDVQPRSGLIDGNGGALSSGSVPRDPRVDPRLVAQQQNMHEQAQPHTPRAQPPVLLHGSLAGLQGSLSNGPGGAGSGLDDQTMAQLSSLLNPLKNTSLPMSSHLLSGSASGPNLPMQIPMPLPSRPHQGPAHDFSVNGSYGGQPGHLNHPSLPGRPRTVQDPYLLHGNDTNGSQFQSAENMQSGSRPTAPTGATEDPTVGPDQIRVISRTLWVGGTFVPTISESDLEAIFAVKGNIATLMINHAKFNAFIKMADRAQAEKCKAELDRTMVQGEVMKVGWGCGFGPRDCFDYTAGSSLIPIDRLTDTDKRWLSNSIVGGFGVHEPIRGGVSILEPNIEPVDSNGREALPKRGKNFASAGATGAGATVGATVGGGRGGRGGFNDNRGRGRGRGTGPMDHAEFAGASRGRGLGVSRGRGIDQQSEMRSHPLPNRPQTGFQGQG
ncbi:hypothetical protein BGX26_009735, partial [Mortierella sp. AD094]